jgi:hypothetical protein
VAWRIRQIEEKGKKKLIRVENDASPSRSSHDEPRTTNGASLTNVLLFSTPTPSISLSLILTPGADFPNYNIREYIRRRARERFREAATTEGGAAAGGETSSSSPSDLAFSAGLRELAAARRQAELARLYHRPQRSVMDVMSTEEHLRREAGRGA